MPLLKPEERLLARTVADLTFCNQFLPERTELLKTALGDEYVNTGEVWNNRIDNAESDANILRLNKKVQALMNELVKRLKNGDKPDRGELQLYVDTAMYVLYYSCYLKFQDVIWQCQSESGNPKIQFYDEFEKEFDRLFDPLKRPLPEWITAPHLFALYFQVRRAFFFIFDCILGGSIPTAKLRASAWQSIFTHDARRYGRSLYQHMGDINTLITGPSGTGKDLVAKAIGMARYVPFDAKIRSFKENFAQSFHTLNISALSPTLVESELFGHVKGSFTGAVQDRVGHLEVCTNLGTIFLDEIGEISPTIQVKLLRVLQERLFVRLGDTKSRSFAGKIIAATNRDLVAEMESGSFRADFYYRLCSDVIRTPSLHEQLLDSPDELFNFVYFLLKRIAEPNECDDIAHEVVGWIEREMGTEYTWPGNVRELEQCVRNIVIRQEYHPASVKTDGSRLDDALVAGTLTADDLVKYYCTVLYNRIGSYQEVARMLELDRRTVKAKIDPSIIERFSSS